MKKPPETPDFRHFLATRIGAVENVNRVFATLRQFAPCQMHDLIGIKARRGTDAYFLPTTEGPGWRADVESAPQTRTQAIRPGDG